MKPIIARSRELMRRGHADTLQRQWMLLRLLPRAPVRATSSELAQRLEREGFSIAKRSVERDLHALSLQFPIELDDRSKPFGWSWHRDAPTFSLPGMSPLQATVLLTANAHLHSLLPAHQLAELAPLMEQARRTLTSMTDPDSPTWADRVAVAPATQALLHPGTRSDVLVAVHEGVFKSQQLEIRYRTRAAADNRSYRVHPLGLVVRGQVTYLACRIGDYRDVRLLAVHRIEAAEVLDGAAVGPRGFRVQEMIPLVAAGFDRQKQIRLVLKMAEPAAEHLHETKLAADQIISPSDEAGWVRVSAIVEDTAQLRWWLLGFGSFVEVLSPKQIRREMASEVSAVAARYSCTS
jgi:predicted DNA-binding transcriptional regulator YafY